MYTGYGPYDEKLFELIQRDTQRQLKAISTAPVFEGVCVRVDRASGSGVSLGICLASLFHRLASAVKPLRRQASRV